MVARRDKFTFCHEIIQFFFFSVALSEHWMVFAANKRNSRIKFRCFRFIKWDFVWQSTVEHSRFCMTTGNTSNSITLFKNMLCNDIEHIESGVKPNASNDQMSVIKSLPVGVNECGDSIRKLRSHRTWKRELVAAIREKLPLKWIIRHSHWFWRSECAASYTHNTPPHPTH